MRILFIIKSIKRELKTRPMNEDRCDEGLKATYSCLLLIEKTRTKNNTYRTPKDIDKVNRRDVCECDG